MKFGNRVLLLSGVVILMLSAGVIMPASALSPMAPEISRECVYGDCQNGYGRLVIRTEFGTDEYEGDFQDGEFHGFGKYSLMVSRSERGYYEGHWENGERHGRGTFWNGRSHLYIGEWRNGLRHGRGSYFFGVTDWSPNRHSEFWLSENYENYSGDFVDDLYQGHGTYRWPDGQRYVGEFYANEKHGPGTFYYPTGTMRPQVWEYGRFIR